MQQEKDFLINYLVEYISAETNYNKNNDGNYNRLDIYDGRIKHLV